MGEEQTEQTGKFIDVYIPVCVTVEVNSDGEPIKVIVAHVDYDGAPWMNTGSDNDVYDLSTDKWLDNRESQPMVEWVIANVVTGGIEALRPVDGYYS